MKCVKLITVCFFFLVAVLPAQTSSLRVIYTRFSATKSFEVFKFEVLEYKLKGESRFRKDKIINMRDSSILFENYEEIKLSQIKALRLKKHNHLVGTFQGFFLGLGVGFIGLNTINNLITDTSPVLNEKAVYISAALIAAGLLIREINIKRIRVTKNKDLKILNIDFQHMATDSTNSGK